MEQRGHIGEERDATDKVENGNNNYLADPLRLLSLISIASVTSSNDATPGGVIVTYFCSFSLSSGVLNRARFSFYFFVASSVVAGRRRTAGRR